MICFNCRQETSNPKFCSRSCSVSFNNRREPKRYREPRFCVYCNVKLGWNKDKFCSSICQGKYRFFKGEITHARTLRKYLELDRGNICGICSNEGIHNGFPLTLEIDHIDGDSDHCHPSNLRFLCPNCHSQQPTSCGGIRNKKFAKRNIIMHRRRGSNG